MALSRSTQIALLVAATFFMENLDATIIATAMPAISQSFGVLPLDLNLAISSYMLALAAFIPISGWLADRLGARVIFCSAIVLFSLASLLCGLSENLHTFLAARILQGMSGAMMVPVGRLAVLRATEKKDLVKAISYITWPALIAPVLGPPLGGWIATHFSWPWIFYVNLPLGAIALVAALWLIPNHTADQVRRFDWLGFLLISTSCATLLYGLELIGQNLKQLGVGAALCAAAAITGTLAIRHMRSHPVPLLDLSVLSIPTYRVTFYGGSLFRIAISTLPFLLPLMFQLAFGWSAITAGSLLIAVFAGNLVMKVGTTWVIQRWGFRPVLLLNGALGVLAIAACALIDASMDQRIIVAILFLGGLSRSLQFTAYNTLGFADVPQPNMSSASTLFSMAFQLSMGIGVAVGALLLRVAMTVHGNSGVETAADFHLAFLLVGVLAAVAMYDSWRLAPEAGAALLKDKAA